jgi:hypothetical protein
MLQRGKRRAAEAGTALWYIRNNQENVAIPMI